MTGWLFNALIFGSRNGRLTLVTPLRTTLTLLRMMAPTRTRLICFESDGTSMFGFPDAAGNRETK